MKEDELQGVVAFAAIVGGIFWWIFSIKTGAIAALITLATVLYILYRAKNEEETLAPTSLTNGKNYWLNIKDINTSQLDIESNAGTYKDMFSFEAVGESNYQKALTSLMPNDGKIEDKHKAYFIANLILEDDNKFDKNAIAVEILGLKVGYIPKEENKQLRKQLKTISKNRSSFSCAASIIGGNNKSYGVWLDI